MARRLPTKIQIKHAENLFCDLNPPCDALDLLDLKATMDGSLSFKENIEELKSEYPQYSWERPAKITAKTYERQFVEGLKQEASQYSYDVVKGSKVKSLERKGRKADKLAIELAECQAEVPKRRKAKPRRCRVKTVRVEEHWRCAPK